MAIGYEEAAFIICKIWALSLAFFLAVDVA